MSNIRPLTWRNVLGFGLGDVANNFAFAMGALFLLNYYTDVAGISAAAAGTMLAAVRIYDAVMDIVAGRVIDRTSTRWGRFRPFLLWGAIPLMLLSIAVFSVPAGWDATEKLIYAYVTYALLGTAYSFVNIPYGSLATVMTQQPRERARLGASRTIMASLTFVFLALVLGPVVRSVSGAELQAQLTQFTVILAVAGLVLYFLCFKSTREVVQRDVESPALKDSVGTLFGNRPLMILCLIALCVLIGYFALAASAMYYARYVLGDAKLFVTMIVIISLVGTLVAAPLVPALVARFGKKQAFLLGLALGAVGFTSLFLSPVTSLGMIYFSLGLGSVGVMMSMTVMWALEADTVEYGEWKTGIRIEGLTYSFFSFTRKCGQALGGSIPAFLLAGSGYIPNAATQSEGALHGIQQAVALVPAAAFVIAFILMLFYPLTDKRHAELVKEIQERRTSNGNKNTSATSKDGHGITQTTAEVV